MTGQIALVLVRLDQTLPGRIVKRGSPHRLLVGS
jgi:hypothetical protein